jgi:hypothetical protein
MADQNTSNDKQQEVRTNFDVFMQQLPNLLAAHKGKFALMRHGQIVEFFDTPGDANRAGAKLFVDGLFSIQQVTESPIDLGFFSHAVSGRPI